MNKNLLGSAIAAALGLSFTSTASMAAVDLDATDTNAAVFATELNLDTNGNLLTSALSIGGELNIGVELGFGFSGGNSDIYVRYDLDNGATWCSNLTGDNFSSGNASDTVALSQGGRIGQNFVVFNITSAASIAQDQLVVLDLHDSIANSPSPSGTVNPTGSSYGCINVINKNPVNVQYRLFDSPTNVANVTGPLKNVTGKILEFSPLLGLSGTTATAIAEVTDDFKLFNSADAQNVARTLADIGTISFGASGTPIPLNNGVVAASATDFLTASTELIVTGDFGAADSISFASDITCTGTLFSGTIAATADSATFVTGTSSGIGLYVCYDSDNVNSMSTGVFTAEYFGTSDVQVGAIRRNGVELLAPFFTLHEVYEPRFYFTNTSDKDAKFSVSVQHDIGGLNAVGAVISACTLIPPYDDCTTNVADCTILANSNKLIKAANMVTGKRCSATFKVAASEEDVHGLFAVRNMNTTDWDSYLMISIGSSSGH